MIHLSVEKSNVWFLKVDYAVASGNKKAKQACVAHCQYFYKVPMFLVCVNNVLMSWYDCYYNQNIDTRTILFGTNISWVSVLSIKLKLYSIDVHWYIWYRCISLMWLTKRLGVTVDEPGNCFMAHEGGNIIWCWEQYHLAPSLHCWWPWGKYLLNYEITCVMRCLVFCTSSLLPW